MKPGPECCVEFEIPDLAHRLITIFATKLVHNIDFRGKEEKRAYNSSPCCSLHISQGEKEVISSRQLQ